MNNAKVNKLIRLHIPREIQNSIIYGALSFRASVIGLNNTAKWLRKQGHDEVGHAEILIDYLGSICDCLDVKIPDLPMDEGGDPVAIMQRVYDLERKTTEHLEMLLGACMSENDLLAAQVVQKLLIEQLEELESSNDALAAAKAGVTILEEYFEE